MNIFLLSSNIIFCCLFVFFLYRYNQLKKIKRKYSKIFLRLTHIINAVRYGKLNERIPKFFSDEVFTKFCDSLNRMIETFEDRENMIKEYQKWLSEKNKSLEILLQKEKETMNLKKDFVATLGHDLKVPIIAEANALNFLLEGRFGELDERKKNVITKLKTSNQELIELVEILLETYKIEDNKITLNLTKCNLETLLQEIKEEANLLGADKKQYIKLQILNNVSTQIDIFQIKRVLKNLILNAYSFSPQNSFVTITLKRNQNNFIIDVTDTGSGILQEDMPHIFDKYYSTAKKFRKVGTGLGLYLANQIVLAHNGSINVESIPNKHTTFTISIPMI